MLRTVSLVFALTVFAHAAQAQPRSAIVKSTPDGFVLADVPDGPLTDGPAVLLTLTSPDDASSGWTLRVLRPGENPMETLRSRGNGVRFTRDTRVTPGQPAQVRLRESRVEVVGDGERMVELEGEVVELDGDRMVELEDEVVELDGEITDVRADRVRYEISAQMEHGFELADPVVSELSDTPALDELALQSDGTGTTVQVRLTFGSLEALNAWRDAGTFAALQRRAASVQETVSVR